MTTNDAATKAERDERMAIAHKACIKAQAAAIRASKRADKTTPEKRAIAQHAFETAMAEADRMIREASSLTLDRRFCRY